MSLDQFTSSITSGYTCKGDFITLGGAMLDGHAVPGLQVNIPLKTLNRHGLIAGATGTGKTKTLQGIAEALSAKGVPSLLMDIKGDLSGLAAAGSRHPKIEERHTAIGLPWTAHAFPVELLTLSGEKGTRLRATVSEFGPVLFSRILGLNDTQGGVVSLVFKYCDDHGMPLLDLKDFKKTLHYLTNDGKKEIEADYGRISTASSSTILRKILELEQQGADIFFGEISFDPDDLLRVDENGYGYLSILRLTDIQDKPKMFSTFMLNLLAEIYATFPEEGDLDQPKLVLFIDEAHLIFNEASKALLEQIETIVRLIRSKGVGVFFCTQQPTDVPDNVLAQLGLKVQHGLRAFTAKDRKMIKTVSENYPLSDFYQTNELLTHLGIGEALITGLNEKGIPTPLVHTLLSAPRSRMDILTADELDAVVQKSQIAKHYNQVIDSLSAHEMLTEKLEESRKPPIIIRKPGPETETRSESTTPGNKREKQGRSIVEDVAGSTVGREVMRTVTRELTRGLLGVLGISSTRRRKSKWF
jgi:DNA helicase HerA-like ATPase